MCLDFTMNQTTSTLVLFQYVLQYRSKEINTFIQQGHIIQK